MPEPREESVLKFKQHKFSQPAPYVIYADFEVLIEPMQNIPGKTASHVPCGYAYRIIGRNGLSPETCHRLSWKRFGRSLHHIHCEGEGYSSQNASLHHPNAYDYTRPGRVSKSQSLQLVQKMARERSGERSRPLLRKI
ncbi:hypothetical protein AVEN_8719-1 [Araneus ventricosus]|uniref:Uncharacterized protein n=1 Tax=Araneus ventricosus TaxID=182803 RepID=A0A4Y2CLS4_ARAVE|nr:hypothetical protein AVEN_8719-1 [Araneus ventricosus]